MLRRNRYRKIPPNPNKRKRERRSVPLERSVHIDGERWGWEYVEGFNHEDGIDRSKIKVLSPDNKFFVKEIKDTQLYGDVIIPSTVKQFIIDKLLVGA
jgi:hypothetical protein